MIGILSACESESHLSSRIQTELYELGLKSNIVHITPNDIVASFMEVESFITLGKYTKDKINFILAVGDRPEQIGGVLAAFQNKVPIGHLYSGDINPNISTFDDKHRHSITLYSNIQFCSSEASMINTREIMRHAGLTPDANLVGATHFDEINVPELEKEFQSCRYKYNSKYILVLINSETLGNDEEMLNDLRDKIKQTKTSLIYLVKGNEDGNQLDEKTLKKVLNNDSYHICDLGRVSHKYFTYLMLHCKEFITNSSCAIYEAPAILPQDIIHIVGKRNSGRTPVPPTAHDGKASMRVAQLIKTFLEARK